MIKVVLTKDQNQNWIKAQAEGHADRVPTDQEDALCAAVSVLMFNTCNSLEALCKAEVVSEVGEDGFLSFEITSEPTEQTQLIYQTLLLGMKSLLENYSRHLELHIAGGEAKC